MLPSSSHLFFGVGDLSVESVEQTGNLLLIHGHGFSSESHVYLDGEALSTTFVSPQLLQVVAPSQTYQTIEIKQHSGLDQAIGQGIQITISELN